MSAARWRRLYYRAAGRVARRRLRGLCGEALAVGGLRRAIAAFRRAAVRVPAYRRYLAEQGAHRPDEVRDAETFASLVPLTDKKTVFAANDLASLCVDGRVDGASAVCTSSGYSGTFSIGLETPREARSARRRMDLLLQMHLRAASRRMLLVNALPMGVRVAAGLPLTFDAGLRADAVIEVVRRTAGECEQVVIAAEVPFLKKIVEDGREQGMDWPRYRVSAITGGEVMPESFRRYVGGLLGHPECGRVFVSSGISELGLTLGHETDACLRIRRTAMDEADVREALFPKSPFLPTLVQYDPESYYIETPPLADGRGHLVVTTCDIRRRLPLIRYATGDRARAMPWREVREALGAVGREELCAEAELPFLAIWGRGKALRIGRFEVYPEQVKEAIYSEAALAAATTALFRMEARDGELAVTLQLKRGATDRPELREGFARAISRWTGAAASIDLAAFEDFPGALELSYQTKFHYM